MAKPSIESTPCIASCCKSPFGCIKRHACRHHVVAYEVKAREAAEARKRHTSPREDR